MHPGCCLLAANCHRGCRYSGKEHEPAQPPFVNRRKPPCVTEGLDAFESDRSVEIRLRTVATEMRRPLHMRALRDVTVVECMRSLAVPVHEPAGRGAQRAGSRSAARLASSAAI